VETGLNAAYQPGKRYYAWYDGRKREIRRTKEAMA